MAVTVKGVTTLKSSTALGGLVPTLNLDFTTPSGIGLNPLNPLVTFSRADAGPYATVTGSDGYLRRAAHNIALYSQDFSNAAWAAYSGASKVGVAGSVSPDGTSNAYEVALGTNGGTFNLASGVYQNLTFAASTTYTISMWVRAKTGSTTARLGMNVGASYDSGDVAVTTSWQRISVTGASSGSGSGNISIRTNVAGNSANVFVYGAQLEQNRTPSYYVPTTSAAVYSTPRFDYNPTTLASLGLLIEESRANTVLQSQSFNISWSPSNVLAFGSGSVVDAAVAPDGTTTAEKIVENTVASTHSINQSFATTSAAWTFSVYAKKDARNFLVLSTYDSAAAQRNCWFNLATGTVGTVNSGCTGTIIPVGNGWYRCVMTLASAFNGGGNTLLIGMSNADNVLSYTGDGVSGLYIWGAQVELGSFATSYIPTTTASVTRAADVASITGTNFSSFWNASAGTVAVNAFKSSLSSGQRYFSAYGAANIRLLDLYAAGSGSQIDNFSNCTGGGSLAIATGLSAGSIRVAFGYAVNNFGGSVNGQSVVSDTSISVDVTATTIGLGGYPAGSNILNGTISSVKYWNTRLTDAQLQAITT